VEFVADKSKEQPNQIISEEEYLADAYKD